MAGQGLVGRLINRLGTNYLPRAARWLRSGRGGVAMAYAIMAPVLIAGTGIAVDIGYWYQQQTSLQSAADAAALAAAQGSVAYNITTSANTTSFVGSQSSPGPAYTFATTAANGATNSRYGFSTSGNATVTLSGTYTTGTSTTGTATYTATVTAPRTDFFSHVSAPLLGLGNRSTGTQSASSKVQVNETIGSSACSGTSCSQTYCTSGSSCACANIKGGITVSGGANVTGTNCGVYAGGTLAVTGSGVIMGSTVSTGQSSVSAPQYSGYIGTTSTSTVSGSSGSNVTVNASAPTDYLANMNYNNTLLWNPGWTIPSAPTESASAVTPTFGYNTWNQSGVGDCVNASGFFNAYTSQNTNYVAYCELYPGYYTGMSSVGVNGLLLNEGTTNGTTYITGGFNGQSNSITQLNGNNYYIDTGMSWSSSTSFTITPGSSSVSCGYSGTTALSGTLCFTVSTGGMSLTNGTATMGSGNYFLNGATTTKKSVTTVSGYGLTTNSPTVTIGGGNWFINGGVDLSGGTTSSSLASGLYEFLSYSGATNGAFYAEQGYDAFGNYTTMPSSGVAGTCPASTSTTTATISPATYYFDGGFVISSGTKGVLLCSGIYYIRNGNLHITSGSTVTGTNVTFILQGTASFTFDGGATINISGPTTTTDPSCITPSAYPVSTYVSPTMPYDGTNGHGICGVVIYQDRNDTATDYVTEGAASVFNGAIYTPNAALVLSGAGAFTINSVGVAALTAASINDSGSGKVTLSETASTDSGSSGSSGSSSSSSSGSTITYATYLMIS